MVKDMSIYSIKYYYYDDGSMTKLFVFVFVFVWSFFSGIYLFTLFFFLFCLAICFYFDNCLCFLGFPSFHKWCWICLLSFFYSFLQFYVSSVVIYLLRGRQNYEEDDDMNSQEFEKKEKVGEWYDSFASSTLTLQ